MPAPFDTLRPCPVCGSSGERVRLHRQRFYEGVLGDGYDVVVCQKCGAGFADGIPIQEELDHYYSERSKYSYDGAGGAESPYDLGRFEAIVEQVAPYLHSADARILDVGCATGGLLSVFKRHGFKNVLGVDPSPACAAAGLRVHNVRIRSATLEQLAAWTERFDLVLLVGVLEHLRDVRPAIETVATRLSPGGFFYAAVPDVEFLAEARNAPFQQFSMEHVNFFSVQSLKRQLRGSGFTCRQTWQTMIEWREGVTEPTLGGIFEKSTEGNGAFDSEGAGVDTITTMALSRYVAVSLAADAGIFSRIHALAESREPILVWGAGALTRRLLTSTPLADCNILAFVDSNTHFHELGLAGRPVLRPSAARLHAGRILICSVAFECEIVRKIRGELGLKNDLITLA